MHGHHWRGPLFAGILGAVAAAAIGRNALGGIIVRSGIALALLWLLGGVVLLLNASWNDPVGLLAYLLPWIFGGAAALILIPVLIAWVIGSERQA